MHGREVSAQLRTLFQKPLECSLQLATELYLQA